MLSQYTKIRIAIVVVICIVLLGIFLFLHRDRNIKVSSFDECAAAGYAVIDSLPARCLDSESTVHTEDVGNIVEMQDQIKITAPSRNTVIISPLVVTGEARKEWFTRGEMLGLIVADDDVVLGKIVLEIEKGHEAEAWREFSGKIEWSLRDTDALKGTIVLKKAGAVGEKNEIRMPIFLRTEN